MNISHSIYVLALLSMCFGLQAQHTGHEGHHRLQGHVYGQNEHGQKEALVQAKVWWEGSQEGTLTDEEGAFGLHMPETQKALRLVIHYSGYQGDTLDIEPDQHHVTVMLQPITTDEVVISKRGKGRKISSLDPVKTEKLGEFELTKAACCNLSESFENNATVDISYSDAVTGAKRIRMLGLDGVYSQIITENIPSIRGLATTFGLDMIPGSWVEGIHVSKGAASVSSGYESITGQINVELKKPQVARPLHLNIFANELGRTEASLNLAHRFSQKWSTALLLHGNHFDRKLDRNEDGFLDLPLRKQAYVLNRWRWHSGKALRGQFGASYMTEDRQGGQMTFDPKSDNPSGYGTTFSTRRWEAFNKIGSLFKRPNTSMGTILNASRHEMDADFGNQAYRAVQQSLYAKASYQSYIKHSNHQYGIGFSFRFDEYDERLNDSTFRRTERVPGVYAEYTYNRLSRLIYIIGARADYHNLYGLILTPRAHLKYNLDEHTVLRASAGSGFRVANVVAEYLPALISSRQAIISEKLDPERAWNYGINLSHNFEWLKRNASLHIDFYRTDFVNQVVADRETWGKIHFSNLKGRSFSNSLQVEAGYEPIEGFDLRLAWKYTDAKAPQGGKLLALPFVPQHRGLVSMGYTGKDKKWQADINLQVRGKARLPNTRSLPEALQRESFSPTFAQLNAQLTRRFGVLELYVGGQNLNNFTQADPIIDAEKPFGEFFDAGMPWGPIVGRRLYAGLRLNLGEKVK